MARFFAELFSNKVMISVLVGFFTANTLKMLLYYIFHRKLNFKVFFQTGGMPSSHTTTVMALSTAVYFEAGISTLFIVTLLFSFIVITDAMGFRRAAGKQAEIINQIVDDISKSKPLKGNRLYELLGHTPKQVFIGAMLGILIAHIIYLR